MPEILLTEEEILQLSRLKELHIKFHKGGGLTRSEAEEYDLLREELADILPIDF